jgi:ankyrin repeat protein
MDATEAILTLSTPLDDDNHEIDIHWKDEDGRTLLFIACSAGKSDEARILLDKGFDVNCVDKFGNTLLHVSIQYADICRILVDRGVNFDSRNQLGYSPIMLACVFGSEEVVNLLLLADAKTTFVVANETALTIACKNNHLGIVESLLLHGDRDIHSNSNALCMMVHANNKEVAKVLLEFGYDPNFQLGRSDGCTLVVSACMLGNTEMVALLLQYGGRVNVSFRGTTLLHEMMSYGSIEIITLILDYGADVNSKNADGDTVLHISYRYRLDKVMLFLQYNPDLDETNCENMTVFDAAKDFDNEDIQKLIEESILYSGFLLK